MIRSDNLGKLSQRITRCHRISQCVDKANSKGFRIENCEKTLREQKEVGLKA